MKPIIDILEKRVSAVMAEIAGRTEIAEQADRNIPAIVKPTQDPGFGDYQVNGVMGLAKKMKCNPRELAEKITAKLNLSDMCEPPQVAGPGFINLRLKPDWLADRLDEAIADTDRLGVDPDPDASITVVDFSGPNIAKQMHVGHLRSTIIGDVIARILEFRYDEPGNDNSAKVIRQNHIGDWGTQFGMLAYYLIDRNLDIGDRGTQFGMLAYYLIDRNLDKAANHAQNGKMSGPTDFSIPDMETFYREAKQLYDTDPEFAERSRECVLKLQSGDHTAVMFWKAIVKKSLADCQETYNRLGVKLTRNDVKGESDYKDELSSVISDLVAAKDHDGNSLLTESKGAQCVFLDGFKTKDGNPLPLIVQKSDGAYLYATTDLAAIRYRVDELNARRIIYVTDARQKLHFEMIFACARRAGWADSNIELQHVPFGSVQGADGKPLKTRSGENIKLKDLLDEAETRAYNIVEQKNPDLSAEKKKEIAHTVGTGAVKYADLSNNLTADYVFSWDRMLAMDGNTAPYMQYAYARVQSIFRKGGIDTEQLSAERNAIKLAEPDELTLAKALLRYGEVLEAVARDLRPHLLTTYLFNLAQSFSSFYNSCPVLQADEPIRTSRLLLCHQTAHTVRHGLALLGIETIEQM